MRSLLRQMASTLNNHDSAKDVIENDILLLRQLVQTLRPSHARERHNAHANVSALVSLLESEPLWCDGLRHCLQRAFAEREFADLYTEFGIIEHRGFWAESWQRLIYKVLPPLPRKNCAGELIATLFHRRDDIEWVSQIDIALWQRLFQLCWPKHTDDGQSTRAQLDEAIRKLGTRVVHIGDEKTIVRLMENERGFSQQLARLQTALLASLNSTTTIPNNAMMHEVTQAIAATEQLKHNSRHLGVSIESTVLLKRLQQSLRRLQQLLQLCHRDEQHSRAISELFIAAVRHANRKHSLREHFADTQELHAEEIVEHASRTGEHYVTESRSEYWSMFRAAALAGVVVAFMAVIKILIAGLHLPIMLEAMAFSLNYGIGFIVVHILHGTIATKQPAMTASVIVQKLQASQYAQQPSRWQSVADLVAQVTRTQTIAIFGNVLLVMPVALILIMVWQNVFSSAFISSEKAVTLLNDLHPWQSLAVFHAAIAGAYLFLAGVISGSFDNRAIFARIPQRIAVHPLLLKIIGPTRTQKLADYIENNLGALAGNFFFGCFLGMTGAIGTLFGLPLDIRHITFSSANFIFGSYALQFHLDAVQWLAYSMGILLIGVMNLAVSFALALTLGLRARGVRNIVWHNVFAAIAKNFRHAPLTFFLPPK